MLLLPLKPPLFFDIHTALATWLDSDQEVSYSSTSANNGDDPPLVLPKPPFQSHQCRAELLRLNALRKALSEAMPKPDAHRNALEENALADLCEYHAALLEFEQRGFPTLEDEHNGIDLIWKAAFAPQQEKHHSLVWDRACCLWNIAALSSKLVQDLLDSASSSGGDGSGVQDATAARAAYKQAVGHCQTAASSLSILKELVGNGFDDFATVEMSKPMLTFWVNIFLAQAQAIIYRMADQTKHSILSGLSQSAHLLMNDALQSAQDPRLVSEVPRYASEWGAYCKAHSMMASAKAEYHAAVLHRQASQWGPELTRLKICLQKLEQCHEFVQPAVAADNASLLDLQREVATYLPFVQNRYHTAFDDNTRVYQDDIPTLKALGDIEPKQLARLTLALPANMQTPKVPLFTKL